MRGDDLVPLLTAPPSAGAGLLGFRQGVVVEWNPDTAENVILVGGTPLVNLPILNTSEALLLAPGAVVAVITYGSSWFILGRVTIPGTQDAATALQMVAGRFVTDVVYTLESTTSTSYTDLPTVGPSATVRVGASGKLLLMLSATISYSSAPGGTDGGDLSVAVSGATTVAAGTYQALDAGSSGIAGAVFSRVGGVGTNFLLTGLNPGSHTVTAKYKSGYGRAVGFFDRVLVAFPM